MANMMAGTMTECTAESGFGVKVHAFWCRSLEFPAKLGMLEARVRNPSDFSVCEDLGYTGMAVYENEGTAEGTRRMARLRRTPDKFFQELPKFLASTKARAVDRLILTASEGSLSLTMLYRSIDLSA